MVNLEFYLKGKTKMSDTGGKILQNLDNLRRRGKREFQKVVRDFVKENGKAFDAQEIDSVQKAEEALAKLQEYKTPGRHPVTLGKNELGKSKLKPQEIIDFLKTGDEFRKMYINWMREKMDKFEKSKNMEIKEA